MRRGLRPVAAAVGVVSAVAIFSGAGLARAQQQALTTPAVLTAEQTEVTYGPYNARMLAGGVGLTKALHEHEPLAVAQANWSMSLWLKKEEAGRTVLLAGVGRMEEATPRYLALRAGRPMFWAGGTGAGAHELVGPTALSTGTWHGLAVSVDAAGTTHLIVDGAGAAHAMLELAPAADVLELAPVAMRPVLGSMADVRHFGGLLAQVSLRSHALATGEMPAVAGLDNLPFEDGSKPWPEQSHAGANGYKAPQDPATLPHSRAAAQAPVAIAPLAGTDTVTGDGARLVLRRGWQMADAAVVKSDGGAAKPEERQIAVTLTNGGAGAAVEAKLTLADAATGERVLPAYYTNNYVSLLPGDTRVVRIAYPAAVAHGALKVGLRGFNLAETTIPVEQ